MPSEIASLTSRNLLDAGTAFGAMLDVAAANPNALMAAGAGIGAIWTNDNCFHPHHDFVGSDGITATPRRSSV